MIFPRYRIIYPTLETVRSLVKGQKNVRWTEVFGAIIGVTKYGDKMSLIEVYRLLVDTLLVYSFEDRATAVRISEFCARYIIVYHQRLFDTHYTLVGGRKGTTTPEDWLLAPLRIADVADCVCIERESDETASSAMQYEEWKFLRVLVRFAFWNGSLSKRQWMGSKKMCKQDSSVLFGAWHCIQTFTGLNSNYVPREMMCNPAWDEMWHMFHDNSGRMLRKRGRGFQRISFLFYTITAMMKESESRDVPPLKILQTLLDVRPDPIVSADELREFITWLLRAEDFDQQVIDNTVDKFVDACVQDTYQPRRLTHLCRVSVRTTLAKNKTHVLPQLVKLLPIPRKLEDFLLCARD